MPSPRHRLALALFALAAAGRCAALDLPLAADAHVNLGLPSANFGALGTLNVGNGSSALLQFDVSPLPVGLNSAKLVKATLKLYVNRVGSAGALELQRINSAWSEAAVTAGNAPALGGPGTGPVLAVTQANQYLLADVTAWVKDWISNPGANFGIALTPSLGAPGTIVFLDSKENTATGHLPQLDLTLADQGPIGPRGATGATGATGAAGATGATGMQGTKGDKGDKGNTGDTGPAGPVTLRYIQYTHTVPSNSYANIPLVCPMGTVVISGGCGHRDDNDAAKDIKVNYSGPEPGSERLYYSCRVTNSNLFSSRAVRVYAVCGSVTSVSLTVN
nr:DNRLRE domain-containing protein [uncultured Roseateles sp.]